jgi:hypothetical protein
MQNFGWKNFKGRDILGDLDIDSMILLLWIGPSVFVTGMVI